MILHKLGLINKNQRGFTLIEIMIAIAITALITSGITTAIFQMFSINTRSTNHMTAVREVQNAGYWVSHDAQMALNVELAEGQPGYPAENPVNTKFPLTLTWTEWDDSNVHRVVYTLEYGGEPMWLKRSHFINGDVSETSVAQYIVPGVPQTNAEFNDDGMLILTVTATVGEASETRVYEIIPRPSL